MIRTSTAESYNAGISAIEQQQVQLDELQQKIASNKRVVLPSDDPVAAVKAERARIVQARATSDARGVDASKTTMTQAESALGSAVDLVSQARTELLTAGNASYSSSDRATIADQLRSLRSQLLAVANQDDGSGHYLLGGQGNGSAPFADTSTGVASTAGTGSTSSGTQWTTGGTPLPMSVDGASAFLAASSGNGVFETGVQTSTGSAWIDSGSVTDPSALTGSSYSIGFTVGTDGTTQYSVLRDGDTTPVASGTYTSGQAIKFDGMSITVTGAPATGDTFTTKPSQNNLSVFDALDKAIAVLDDSSATSTQVTQAVQTGAASLKSSMAQLSRYQSEAGNWLNQIDAADTHLTSVKTQAKTVQSNAEDMDLVEGASQLKLLQTSYDAALQTYTSVQKLSLFNYMSS